MKASKGILKRNSKGETYRSKKQFEQINNFEEFIKDFYKKEKNNPLITFGFEYNLIKEIIKSQFEAIQDMMEKQKELQQYYLSKLGRFTIYKATLEKRKEKGKKRERERRSIKKKEKKRQRKKGRKRKTRKTQS